jgi:multiple sugar transport system ATP-binding protein
VAFLELMGLKKTYQDGTEAVRGIDAAIEEGEFIVLLGPSGCGKTTTLRMIAGLEIPTAGGVSLGGRDVTCLRPSGRDVGFVFQFYALYPHLSVRANILFPLESVGMEPAEREKRLAEVAARLGLERLLRLYPSQLSGGDQQRVSLARAMVRRPAVYLMDEPLGTLDADLRLEMREFIRSQQLEMKVTTIYVTHDQEEAMGLADRVAIMEAGLVRQFAPPIEVYDDPADLFVANFVGSPGMNFVPGEVVGSEGGSAFKPDGCETPMAVTHEVPPGRATLGIRPEHVHPVEAGSGDGGAVEGKVVIDEYLGAARCIHVDAPFGRLIVRTEGGEARGVGSVVTLGFDPGHVRLFDPESGRRL